MNFVTTIEGKGLPTSGKSLRSVQRHGSETKLKNLYPQIKRITGTITVWDNPALSEIASSPGSSPGSSQ